MPALSSCHIFRGSHISQTIRSLDSLNDQIVEFFISGGASEAKEDDDFPRQRLVLAPSVALMKKLLLDAQGKFRKMVEENQQLAARIDGELQTAHVEVDVLRRDLADTNRRIAEMQETSRKTEGNSGDQQQPLTNGTEQYDEGPKNCLKDQISLLRDDNLRLQEKNSVLLREVDELRYLKDAILKCDESRPPGEEKEVDLKEKKLDPNVTHLALELTHAKEALSALKTDRKRLKAEKFDLLNQMKQLYATLEDKERELRDFIRNYEQRMKDSDESLRQLANERDESEREKWNLLKHARDEAERAVALASQLGQKDMAVKRLEEELEAVRKQMSALGYCSDADSIRTNGPNSRSGFTPTCSPLPLSTPTPPVSTPTCSPLPLSNCTSTTNGRGSSADSGVRLSSDRDSTASQEGGPETPNRDGYSTIYANPTMLREGSRSSLHRRQDQTPPPAEPKNDSSCTTPVNGTSDATFGHSIPANMAASADNGPGNASGTLSRSAEQLFERVNEASNESIPKGRGASMTLTRKGHKGGGTWGSISRVFARQKKRTAIESSANDGDCKEQNTEEISSLPKSFNTNKTS